MRKLIIGCGYLGRRVAAAWRARGEDVFALTRSAENAAALRGQGVEPVLGDVTDAGSLAGLPAADTVLYAVGYDRASGKSARAVSVAGLENVLREIAPRTGRLIFVSSTSVYGQSHGEWVDESSPCEPSRPNGQVALEAEQVVRRLAPRAHVLRLAGIYGPGRLLQRIGALRAATPLGGDPDGWLNLIHVDDAAAAVLAGEERGGPGETYLVGDDRPVRRRDYYARLAELVGAPPPTYAPEQDAARTAGLNKRCSNRRLREELGVTLRYPTFLEGLPHAVQETPF